MLYPSPTHVLHGKHTFLIGKSHGLFVGVCLGCSGLLGVARDLHLLVTLDQLHRCPKRPQPVLRAR